MAAAAATSLDSRERSPGGRSGLGAHTQPVPPLSPSRGRAEGGARRETCSQNTHAGMWGRQGLGEAKPPVETTGQRGPQSGFVQPLLGPGSALSTGSIWRYPKGVSTLASHPFPTSPPTSPPESSSSRSICFLTDRGGAMTQPHRAPGAQALTFPGLEGGCACHRRWRLECPLFGGACDSSLEGSPDPFFSGCRTLMWVALESRLCAPFLGN